MTEIYFYSGAYDKLTTACRLCAKALQQNMRVLIYILDTAVMNKMDELLWTFSATSFVPHCSVLSQLDKEVIESSPVIISNNIQAGVHFDVLLNLHSECPPMFEQFNRLIEIVDLSDHDSESGRHRFRCYKQKGFHNPSSSTKRFNNFLTLLMLTSCSRTILYQIKTTLKF